MKQHKQHVDNTRSGLVRNGFVPALLTGLLAGVCAMPAVSLDVSRQPLAMPVNIPGNLFLVPSVEYPTIDSQANIGEYDPSRLYSGYFDAKKCYLYSYSATESDRHFFPNRKISGSSYTCDNARKEWSGNYLNWMATHTIDPFRSALTGGNRVKDEPGVTWLEKARSDRTGGYAQKSIRGNQARIKAATPAHWGYLWSRIDGLKNKVRFTGTGNLSDNNVVVAYNPSVHNLADIAADWSKVYELSMRVQVCDASVGVEDNCKQYSQGWKPEGLIQEYSSRIRYSIFGFLNESGNQRNGGVMRARQKFVGPETHYPEEGARANSGLEWDATTGVLIRNPDSADATATGHGVQDSGVINYLNKFGQMTAAAPKANDPVSELYYSMLRYVRGDGNVATYSSGLNYERADGFPVIENWDDPIRYACQVNAALGIGDVNTHMDHDLPAADRTLAQLYTDKIFSLEGINKRASADFSGRGNSAYIAGLAYYAHTNDLRTDLASAPNSIGNQSLSTYWVDVREDQYLQPKVNNQYWLAGKYGSFRVPLAFDALATTAIPNASWHTSGEYLTSGNGGGVTRTDTGYPRPDGFYVASEADKMVQSLRKAFEQISLQSKGSGTALAQSSRKLEAGAYNYQATYLAGTWAGELAGLKVDPNTGAQSLDWTTATNLTGTATGNDFSKRKLFYNNGGKLQNFIKSWTGNVITGSVSVEKPAPLSTVTDDQMRYILGDRSQELQYGGALRDRASMLGAIINSQPLYLAGPLKGIHQADTSYDAYLTKYASRTPIVYVGANDGMLHAINASTGPDRGKEVFAFMPTAAMDVLKQHDPANNRYPIWMPEFANAHSYSVDGEITVADVKTTNGWKSILVGTLGRGGKGVYALDVTDPANPVFLWEKSGGDIGNVLGKPIIAKVADNDWRVFFGNGPNSGVNLLGTSVLDSSTMIALDVLTGADNGSATVATVGDQGMGPVNVWDSNGDGNFDTVYAGDMGGGLWKIDIASGKSTLLFLGGDSITAQPLVVRNPDNVAETWVTFGTGRYLGTSDISAQSNVKTQRWIGLIDEDKTLNVLNLEKVEIVHEDAIGRVIDENIQVDGRYRGWYIELVSPVSGMQGERMVLPNQLKGNRALIGISMYPSGSDVCQAGGGGHVMVINPFTGGRLSKGFFDIDGSGSVGDAGDKVVSPPGTSNKASGADYSGITTGGIPGNVSINGNKLRVPTHLGTIKDIGIGGANGPVRRVSWRELINEN